MTQMTFDLPLPPLDPPSNFQELIDIVEGCLRKALSPGTPPAHRRIVSATFERTGHTIGILEMFDGRPATIECIPHYTGRSFLDPIYSHRFIAMPGGSASFVNGAWRRLPEAT